MGCSAPPVKVLRPPSLQHCRTRHSPPSQNTQGPSSHCFEDINFGKGESASAAPGLGVEVFGGWCPNFSVLADHLGSLLERILSGPHPKNRCGKTAAGAQESPLELTVVLIGMSSDPI